MFSSRSQREAFTLVELLIALSLLVVLVAMAWPGIMRLFFEQKMQRAAAEIQRALADARIAAVNSGDSYQFEYEPGGNRYRFGAEEPPMVDGTTSEEGDQFQEFELSDGLNFAGEGSSLGSSQPPAVSAPVSTATAGSGNVSSSLRASATWNAPIVFRPDGSSQDTHFDIDDPTQGGASIRVSIRGLTGHATVKILRGRGEEE